MDPKSKPLLTPYSVFREMLVTSATRFQEP